MEAIGLLMLLRDDRGGVWSAASTDDGFVMALRKSPNEVTIHTASTAPAPAAGGDDR